MAIVNIKINDRNITAEQGKTILEAAMENGIEIPHLCFDHRVKPYGACGLCVVEIEGNPKLQRACSVMVSDGMSIHTETPRTAATRKAAVKLLVSDHRGDCRPPCVLACPAHTDCQGYVGLIANGQYKEAVELIKEQLPLPASIGRVCPHPCEDSCRRAMVEEPISIAALKTFVGDLCLNGEDIKAGKKPPTGKKVAIVGAGPCGLTCAYFLGLEGHNVTIFEAMPKPGGMLQYGIPEYRLPKSVLDKEIKLIENIGVEIKCGVRLGKDIDLEYLKNNFDAVNLAVGAWKSSKLGCIGEDMNGVLGGIDFLAEVSANKKTPIGRRVLVVGGGNTAMDVARTSVRLGAEKVSIIYRRTMEEMPAEEIEIIEAQEEGVDFNFLYAPVEVLGDRNGATGLKCQKMRLGEPDASGRRKPEPIPGEEVVFDADTIISAIGQKVVLNNVGGLKFSRHGTIEADGGTFETSIPAVFAGGDGVTGPKVAIEAVSQGKKCAYAINGFLNGNLVPHRESKYVKQQDLTEEDYKDRGKVSRAHCSVIEPQGRKHNFNEVARTLTRDEASKEALRCLECGCRDCFECRLLKYIHQYDIDPEDTYGEKHKRKENDSHPFIERDGDKCILCGLCVRTCDEIMDVAALGLVGRGFDSVVKPEFEMPLNESCCISCGLCTDVCPTGACMEKQSTAKQVPLKFETAESICSYCGLGCKLILEKRGDKVYRALPYKDNLLCAKGKFGIYYINDKNRLLRPMVKEGESFKEISFDEAVLLAVENLTSKVKKYGRDSIAFAVSPDISNETAQMVKEMASKLGTDLTGSFTRISKGLSSTAKLENIKHAEAIFIVGDIYKKYPVLGTYIKNAAKMGADVIDVKNAGAAGEVIQEHIDRGLKAAKKTIIIIDEDILNDGLIKLGMKVCNSIGVILVRSKSNSQGILNLGFDISGCDILDKINNGTVKALVVMGEDPAGYIDGAADAMKRLEFLLTADLYTTKTSEYSRLVLPLSSFAENGGSYTRCDGVIQYGIPAVKPISKWSSNKVLAEITKSISPGISSTGVIHKKYGNGQVLSSIDYSAEKSVFSTIDFKFERYLLGNGIKV